MCTVSFISKNDTFFFTSNRDEHTSRPASFEPKTEIINGLQVTYPKDPKAGGTWFAINENKVVTIVLNGAFEKHESKGGYARSRGLILLDIISAADPMTHITDIDLENIEPFTLVLFQEYTLTELRWDGTIKHIKELDSTKNYIWSSATLYSKTSRQNRENLFAKFLLKNKDCTATDISDFHQNNHDDYENGFVIDRNSGLKTFSVTQAVFDTKKIVLDHLDLNNNKQYSVSIVEKQIQDQPE